MTRDEAVAKLLAGAVAAGHLDGGRPGPIDRDAGTAEMTFDGVTYVVFVTEKGLGDES